MNLTTIADYSGFFNFSTISSLENSTDWSHTMFLLGIIRTPISVIGFVGGVICLFMVLTRFSNMRNSTRILLINLIITSLMFSGIVMPMLSYTLILGPENVFAIGKYPLLCKASGMFFYWIVSACAYSHATVAVNRLIIVVFQDRHKFLTSGRMTALLVLSVWVSPVLIYIWPLLELGGRFGWVPAHCKCYLGWTTPVYTVFYKIAYSLLPLTIMLLCYFAIFLHTAHIKRNRCAIQILDIGQMAGKSNESVLATQRQRRELKATRVMFFSCLGFVFAFLPTAIFGFIDLNQGAFIRSCLALVLESGCAMHPIWSTLPSADLRARRCELIRSKKSRNRVEAATPS